MGLRIEKENGCLTLRFEKEHLGYQKAMLDVSRMALPHVWEEEESEIRLVYHQEGRTLKTWIRTDPDAQQLEAFFRAVVQLDEQVDCFLLDEGRILFDPDWIGWDMETKKVTVVYSPFDPYALCSVPFWSRLAGYFHQALIAGLFHKEGVETVILQAERAAYLRKKKDPAWAGSWAKRAEAEEEQEVGISEKTEDKTERMAEREKALDQLIKAQEEESASLFKRGAGTKVFQKWQKNVSQWKDRFPIAIKD